MKILVYGWYRQGNLGDDFFIEAFQKLFPKHELRFTEIIDGNRLKDVDAVFFGGGSFLLDPPNASPEALDLLKKKKLFYIGVGVEARIHPIHVELMSRALLIATRSIDKVECLQLINPNSKYIPDLVYALQSEVKALPKISRSVLIMPNMLVVPQRTDPHWMHAAWAYYKSEFVQFLDWLVEENYLPHLFSMCHAVKIDDDWAATELLGHMEGRDRQHHLTVVPVGFSATTALFSRYETIVTQRFHGIVLAEMTRTPYLAIHHHDKLKLCQPNEGKFLSYYNCSKHSLIEAFNQAQEMNYSSVLPIETNIFKALVDEVISLL